MTTNDTKSEGKEAAIKTGKTAKTGRAGTANPAPPARSAATKELRPVEELAAAAGVKEWELAGLMRAAGWAEGKECAPALFARALAAFRARPQGGGRIAIS